MGKRQRQLLDRWKRRHGSVRADHRPGKDTCKGTKFKVTEGIGITVFDKKKKKKIKLGPGDKYFAAT